MDLRELRYGIEIETVKRTREQIAWAIHSVVGGHVSRWALSPKDRQQLITAIYLYVYTERTAN